MAGYGILWRALVLVLLCDSNRRKCAGIDKRFYWDIQALLSSACEISKGSQAMTFEDKIGVIWGIILCLSCFSYVGCWLRRYFLIRKLRRI